MIDFKKQFEKETKKKLIPTRINNKGVVYISYPEDYIDWLEKECETAINHLENVLY